jgi:hypothetical protein
MMMRLLSEHVVLRASADGAACRATQHGRNTRDAAAHAHLHAGQDLYWNKPDGSNKKPPHEVAFPDEQFDGYSFGFMEKSETEFLFVSVDRLVLPQPVLLVGKERHGVAAPGPSFPRLDDDVAANILVDAMLANPALRDALGRRLRALGR